MRGFPRKDGRKGIRNVVAVAYLVECAHHVSRLIVQKSGSDDVHLIGFPGCYPNKYSLEMMQRLCTHPNVGAVLLVSLGCEGFNREQLRRTIAASGRPVDLLVIQQSGGTTRTLNAGLEIVRKMRAELAQQTTGADGARRTRRRHGVRRLGRHQRHHRESGRRPLLRLAHRERRGLHLRGDRRAHRLRTHHGLARHHARAGREIEACVEKAANYYRIMGYGSFAPGNAEGGLTTLEEKSMGAYSKSGSSPISGLIKPGDVPPRGGLYLLDVVPDGEPRFGFPNISDNAEIVELIACGSHLILFTTGRGSVVGFRHLAGHQGLRESGHLRAHGRRHGRERRPHPARRRSRRRGPRDLRTGAEASRAASCRSPRRSATRNSSSPTNNSNRSARPACRPPEFQGDSLETGTFWFRGRGAPWPRDRGRRHRRPVGRHSGSGGRRAVARVAREAALRSDACQTTARADRHAPGRLRRRRRQVHRHRPQLRRSRRRNRRQDSERAHRVHEGHELHRRPERHRAEAARLHQDGLGSRARRRHRQRHALRERGRCAETHRGLLRDQRSVRAAFPARARRPVGQGQGLRHLRSAGSVARHVRRSRRSRAIFRCGST